MKTPPLHQIIDRYFRGKITDAEAEQLSDYLAKGGKEAFETAKENWAVNPEVSEETTNSWNRLQFRIRAHEETQGIKISGNILLTSFLKAAAILVFGLLMGGGLAYYLFKQTAAQDEQLVFETPRGEKSQVTLPDGSQVWLNAKTKLVYHTFTGSKERKVDLTGEAFFQVKHNESAPFVVNSNHCRIKVLGTSFNVMAYDAFGRMEITLVSGKVNVSSETGENVLKPGEALILKDHTARVVEGNSSQASGWVDNKFNFRNIPLSELMMRLENWYDVDITFDNRTGKEVNFTGTFKNEETIWQVLDAIKVYTPIEYTKTNLRQIKIYVK